MKNTFIAVGIVIVVFLVGGLFWWKMGEGEFVKNGETTRVVSVPEGIHIVDSSQDNVLINNDIDGYSIDVGKPDKIVYEEGSLGVSYPMVKDKHTEGGGYVSTLHIVTMDSTGSIQKWAENWVLEQSEPEFYSFDSHKTSDGQEYILIVDKSYFGGPHSLLLFQKG